MKKFFFFFIFFLLFSNIGWCHISVSVSPVYYHTSTIIDSFEMKISNHGDEPIRISFFLNEQTTKSTVKYVHFIRGNNFFLNIGESLTVPVKFSFVETTSNTDSVFPIICEITSLKKFNSSFEPKFRMFFYVSKIENRISKSINLSSQHE
jgi:bacteriorhodopsin